MHDPAFSAAFSRQQTRFFWIQYLSHRFPLLLLLFYCSVYPLTVQQILLIAPISPFVASLLLLCLPTHCPAGWEMEPTLLSSTFSFLIIFLCFAVCNSCKKNSWWFGFWWCCSLCFVLCFSIYIKNIIFCFWIHIWLFFLFL